MTLGPHTIGILGGLGPEATMLLQRKVMDAVPGRDDRDHIPLLIDMNPQVPSRIAHLIEGTGEDPSPTLVAMARRLENAGCFALAMPCNTAHYYVGAITGAVKIPLLNMIDLAAEHAMLVAIRQIKAEGPVPQARDALMQASLELSAAGAQMQFIACSEFSLIADNVADGAQSVDTVDLLAQAIVDASNAD
jgi:aspartate racemase